jgi:hypothetical protein
MKKPISYVWYGLYYSKYKNQFIETIDRFKELKYKKFLYVVDNRIIKLDLELKCWDGSYYKIIERFLDE